MNSPRIELRLPTNNKKINPSSKRRRSRRRGATAVEFAIVSPIYFLIMFACFEFGRATMVDAFTEEAAFSAARHVLVPGAKVQEGIQRAQEELGVLSIQNAAIAVIPTAEGTVQGEIDEDTDLVEVTIRVPMADNSLVGFFFRDVVLERAAKLKTERF